MSQNLVTAENSFPTFQKGESPEAKIRKLADYLTKLTEQLRFTLQNLDAGNWNAEALAKLKAETTSEISKTVTMLQELVACSEEGVTIGKEGKRVDIVGQVYINGVLFE